MRINSPMDLLKWQRALRDDERISSQVFATAVMISTYMDKKGACYPKQKTLAETLGKSTETVRRHLRKLENVGYLSTKRIPGRTTEYQGLFAEKIADEAPHTDEGEAPDSSGGVPHTDEGWTPHSRGVVPHTDVGLEGTPSKGAFLEGKTLTHSPNGKGTDGDGSGERRTGPGGGSGEGIPGEAKATQPRSNPANATPVKQDSSPHAPVAKLVNRLKAGEISEGHGYKVANKGMPVGEKAGRIAQAIDAVGGVDRAIAYIKACWKWSIDDPYYKHATGFDDADHFILLNSTLVARFIDEGRVRPSSQTQASKPDLAQDEWDPAEAGKVEGGIGWT